MIFSQSAENRLKAQIFLWNFHRILPEFQEIADKCRKSMNLLHHFLEIRKKICNILQNIREKVRGGRIWLVHPQIQIVAAVRASSRKVWNTASAPLQSTFSIHGTSSGTSFFHRSCIKIAKLIDDMNARLCIFRWLDLGCIRADFCDQILILQHLSRSTILSFLCTFALLQTQKFRKWSSNFFFFLFFFFNVGPVAFEV